jgi:hypothetical protein
MMRWGLAFAAVVLVAACVGRSGSVVCSDPGLQRFLGQPLEAAVNGLGLSEGDYKVDYPSPYGLTLEEFPDRLRMSVDEAGVIRGIGCG